MSDKDVTDLFTGTSSIFDGVRDTKAIEQARISLFEVQTSTVRLLAMLYKMVVKYPRAWKLMRLDKPFLVVSNSEVYYARVYDMIKEYETKAGTWTAEDEAVFEQAMQLWAKTVKSTPILHDDPSSLDGDFYER